MGKIFDFSFLFRKKKYDQNSIDCSSNKLLNVYDLTALGFACTLGSGAYVLIGPIIVNYAGPATILSFLIAAAASLLSGMSYAEIGARIPRCDSAYIYLYVTVGEFIAFVIGTASTVSALSLYIDSLDGNVIQTFLREVLPINLYGFNYYADILSFIISLLVTTLLIIGVKESSVLTTIFTIFNVFVIILIIISGSVKANSRNWNLNENDLLNATWNDSLGNLKNCSNHDCGNGGFFPFGISGVFKGAATCFFSFIGYDCITTTGAEVYKPQRTIPLSIILTLLIVALSYIGVSIVITLMIPYYMLDINSPFYSAFNYVQLTSLNYVVTIGAIISISTCLYASMFPMPKMVYLLSNDGLFFHFFTYNLPKFKTKIWSCLFVGVISATMSMIFSLEELINDMSIGTLMAYSIVSACVIILRYRPSKQLNVSSVTYLQILEIANKRVSSEDSLPNEPSKSKYTLWSTKKSEKNILKFLFLTVNMECDDRTAFVVTTLTIIAIIVMILLCLLLNLLPDLRQSYSIFLISFFSAILIILSILIYRQPQNQDIKTFKIPFVPFFPMMGILVNIYLMTQLDSSTWIRFGIWFGLGQIVYFLYGMRFSLLNKNPVWFPFILRSKSKYDNSRYNANCKNEHDSNNNNNNSQSNLSDNNNKSTQANDNRNGKNGIFVEMVTNNKAEDGIELENIKTEHF